jgi:hypothetical protein
VFNSESQAASFIRARIAKGTVVHADEAASWDNLHERFEVKRINHLERRLSHTADQNGVAKLADTYEIPPFVIQQSLNIVEPLKGFYV